MPRILARLCRTVSDHRGRRMLDVNPLLGGPATGFKPKGRLALVPSHDWDFLTYDVARAGLVTRDDEMAIITCHAMPRRPAHTHGATATAGTRRASFANTLHSNPTALQDRPRRAADCLQRRLRSGFRQQLTPGVRPLPHKSYAEGNLSRADRVSYDLKGAQNLCRSFDLMKKQCLTSTTQL